MAADAGAFAKAAGVDEDSGLDQLIGEAAPSVVVMRVGLQQRASAGDHTGHVIGGHKPLR